VTVDPFGRDVELKALVKARSPKPSGGKDGEGGNARGGKRRRNWRDGDGSDKDSSDDDSEDGSPPPRKEPKPAAKPTAALSIDPNAGLSRQEIMKQIKEVELQIAKKKALQRSAQRKR
jgi:hypothetical protein